MVISNICHYKPVSHCTVAHIVLISPFHLMPGYVNNLAPVKQPGPTIQDISEVTDHILYRAPDMPLSCGHPKPRSQGCRWRIHWRNVHGRYCYCSEFPTQTVYLKHWSTQGFQPGQGRGPQQASGGQGGISCGSFGLSRSRKCS